MTKNWIGTSVPRKEGFRKVTGKAQYVDDIYIPEMWFGATVRSPAPRGKIINIVFDKNIPWDEFVIVTAKDIPGKNVVALLTEDQPYLADGFVNHPEEPVLLIAHPDKYLLEKARSSIKIEIDPQTCVFSIEDSLKKSQIVWGKDNIFKSFLVQKGDVDSIWKNADFIVEGEYATGAQEQLYIENNGMIAVATHETGVTVWGSMQCPYYVHKALLALFNLPEEKIRVVQTETGGGFGGKEEYPSIIAGHAALLALKSKKPIKIIYDRAEDMAATTKRHPSRTKHKTAVTKDGKILGMDIEFVLDGGAYVTLSPVVLSRGTLHAAGPYFSPHVRIQSHAVATNHPPHGAFRGFGAPQSIFALERHMDKIAKTVGLAPEELRRRNFIKDGQTTATEQIIQDHVDMNQLLNRALELSGYYEKKEKFKKSNLHSQIKKGIGFASFMHGAGFTGSGEKYLSSIAAVEATEQGVVRILASSTEIGQGTNTIFSQIAAEALGLDPSQIEVVQPDTAFVPNSGPTVASRTCMVVGKLVEEASIKLKQILIQSGVIQERYSALEFKSACKAYLSKFGKLKATSQYKQPAHINWDDEKYKGDAYATYAWAVYVAEVSVNTLTYETQVDDFVAVQEIGRVVNPTLAAGQIEGGVAQSIGYALYEKVVWKEGRMLNGQMTNYIMPTAADVPPIRVFFEEVPCPYGPKGAKGIGELPMDGTAPAILNAIEDAVGVSPCHIPFMPEDLLNLIMESKRV